MRHNISVILGLGLTLATGQTLLATPQATPDPPGTSWQTQSDAPVCPDVWTTHGPVGGPVDDVAIDPTDSRIVYAATLDGLYKTSDGGASWSLISSDLAATDIVFLTLAAGDPPVLYAATQDAIYRWTEQARTWVLLDRHWSPLAGGVHTPLVVDPRDHRILYAGIPLVSKSLDGGASWSVLDEGLPEAIGEPWLLSLDPADRHTLLMAPSGKGFYLLHQRCVFADDFETGDVTAWSSSVP